jgi:hypothetical protein
LSHRFLHVRDVPERREGHRTLCSRRSGTSLPGERPLTIQGRPRAARGEGTLKSGIIPASARTGTSPSGERDQPQGHPRLARDQPLTIQGRPRVARDQPQGRPRMARVQHLTIQGRPRVARDQTQGRPRVARDQPLAIQGRPWAARGEARAAVGPWLLWAPPLGPCGAFLCGALP